VQFGPPPADLPSATQGGPIVAEQEKSAPAPREKRPREKIDPALASKARELRDRYLEQANDRLLLPVDQGKYDVSRTLKAAHPALARLAG
jgi:hypothetical protein